MRIFFQVFTGLMAMTSWLGAPALSQDSFPMSQSITWTGPVEPVLDLNQPYPISAKADSGLPVTVAVEFGPATLANGILTVTGPGLVQVTADQPGEGLFLPVRATRNFNYRGVTVARSGKVDTTIDGFDLTVAEGRAYVAESSAGLRVIDVSDPAKPARLGVFNTTGTANGVQVVGKTAYVADGSSGLQIIDVTDPAAPVRLGVFNTAGTAGKVQVAGTIAYVADGSAGLQIIDATDPAAPVRLATYAPGGLVQDVKVVGSIGYILIYRQGNGGTIPRASLEAIDITLPASPASLGSLDLADYSEGNEMAVAGHYVYVATGETGLEVVDVSDPAHPVSKGRFYEYASYQDNPLDVPSGRMTHVRVVGDVACVMHRGVFGTTSFGGFFLFDLSNPAHPHRVGGFVEVESGDNFVTGNPMPNWWGLEVSGSTVFVTVSRIGVGVGVGAGPGVSFPGAVTSAAYSLETFSVRAGLPQALHWAGSIEPKLTLNVPHPLRVIASSGLPVAVRVASGPATIAGDQLIVTGPGTVQVIAEQSGDASHLPVQETRVFNLQEVKLSPVATVESAGGLGIDVVGNIAYVTRGNEGLKVVDVNNPASPIEVGGYDTSGTAFDVQVLGNLAFVADGTAGLQVIDVSDLAHPARLGGYNTSGEALGVQVVGNYAFVADRLGGIVIIDVSTPAAPVLASTFKPGGIVYSVRVVGNLAYVANGDRGLVILDVSNPAKPVGLVGVNTSGVARDVDVVGNLAYIADGSNGLQLFDVRDPAKPVRVGGVNGYFPVTVDGNTYSDSFEPKKVRVLGNLALAVSAGFQSPYYVLDVSNPANPIQVASFNTEGGFDAAVAGGRLYLQNGSGLSVFEGSFAAAPPTLGVRRTSQQLELTWATDLPGLRLQSRGALSSGSAWENVTATLQEAGGQARVNMENSGSARFFRLVQP